MKKTIASIIALVLISTGASALELSGKQANCLSQIWMETLKYGEIYGDTWAETAMAIGWIESHCSAGYFETEGVIVGDLRSNGTPKSLGGMQVQVPAARDVQRWYPHIFEDKFGKGITPTDEELIIALLTDLTFNIRCGVAYFIHALEYHKGNWNAAILSYNRGPGHKWDDIHDYIRKVKKYRKTVVKPFMRGDWTLL